MRVVAALGLLCAGCVGGPDPIPFRGPAPRVVWVVPSQAPGDVPVEALDVAMGEMLAERGFVVESLESTTATLAGMGWHVGTSRIEDLPFAELRKNRGVEAVWVAEIRQWAFETVSGYPFVFGLQCSMYATRDRSTLWTCRLDGRETTAQRRTVIDPHAERDPFEAENPFVWKTGTEVLTDRQIADLVARSFGLRLPR